MTLWSAWGIDFSLAPLFTDINRGAEVIAEFLRPNWSFLLRPVVIGEFIATLAIAVVATLFGCSVALGLSMLASPVSTVHPLVSHVTKTMLSIIRALPDIAYGLLFVAVVQTGSLAGILALIFFNIGIAAKLTSESIDAVDPGPIEAADASGARKLQRARVAILPQIAPNYLSYCFYIFELNIRASVVIGIVGGGGIGVLISTQLAGFRNHNVSAILVALIVVVFVLDRVSRTVRERIT